MNNIYGNKGSNLLKLEKYLNVPPFIIIGNNEFSPLEKKNYGDYFSGNISIRSSPVYSMPGAMDTILDVDPSNIELVHKIILDVFNSYNNPLAIKYRKLKGLPECPPAVILQKMVYGDYNEKSGTGILFTRNSMGELIPNGEFLQGHRGPDLVNNIITNTNTNIFEQRTDEFMNIAMICEEIFKEPQEIEFTIQDDIMYILQSRTLQFNNLVYINILRNMVTTGILTEIEFESKLKLFFETNPTIRYIEKEPINYIQGIPTSGGLIKINNIDEIYIAQKILNEDIEKLSDKSAVITHEGAVTSHPSIICRNLGIPYIIINKKILDNLVPPFIVDGYNGRLIFDDINIINVDIKNYTNYV